MSLTDLLHLDPMWLPAVIFFARITDVSIGTLRLICIIRGYRPLAVALSFAEVLVWIFAITNVMTHLDQPLNILAFAAGYATGSAVGMWIESRLALGTQILTFISKGTAHAVAERIRFADHSVTSIVGRGHGGPVAICYTTLPRRFAATAIRMAREIDPNVVVTVADVRATAGNYLAHCGVGKTPLSWQPLAQPIELRGCRLAMSSAANDGATASGADIKKSVPRAA